MDYPNPQDEFTPEEIARLQRMTQHVWGLLMKAGWLQGTATNRTGAAIKWTPVGLQKAKQLKMLARELGSNLTGEELGCVIATLETLGPEP